MIDDISVMQCEACWSQSIKVFGSFLWLFTVCSKIEARNFRAMPQITESRIIVASVTLPRKKWGKKRVFLACRQERHLLPKKGKKSLDKSQQWLAMKLGNRCTLQFIWVKHYISNNRRKPCKFCTNI